MAGRAALSRGCCDLWRHRVPSSPGLCEGGVAGVVEGLAR